MTLTSKHLAHEAYTRFKNKLIQAYYIEIEAMESNITILINNTVLYIVLPSLYVLALTSNSDTLQNLVMGVLLMMTGVFGVFRVGLKFFQELIKVLVEWQNANIKIEGAKWLFIIIGITFIVIIISLICIALYVYAKQ